MKRRIKEKLEDLSFTIWDVLVSWAEFDARGGWRSAVTPLISSLVGWAIGVWVATQIAIHCFW